MTTKKQARAHELKRQEQLQREIKAAHHQHSKNRKTVAIVTVAALVIALITIIAFAVANSGDDSAPAAPGGSVQPSAAASAADSDAEATADASSDPTAELEVDLDGWANSATAPEPKLAQGKVWTVQMDTNQGPIVLMLDGVNAPQAVASFISLAQDDFFDATECHRLTTAGIYVLQCGDPTATGTGGPAYRFGPLENMPADDLYPAGSLAMARIGNDAESMGSQFFIVYEDSVIPSDAAGGYTVFGEVSEGLAIIDAIAQAGTITGDSDGRPAQSVIVNEVTVS